LSAASPNLCFGTTLHQNLIYYRNSRHNTNRLMSTPATQVPLAPMAPESRTLWRRQCSKIPVHLGRHIANQLPLHRHLHDSCSVLAAIVCPLHKAPMSNEHCPSTDDEVHQGLLCSLCFVSRLQSAFFSLQDGATSSIHDSLVSFPFRVPPLKQMQRVKVHSQTFLRLLCWSGVDFLLEPSDALSDVKSIVLLPVAESIFLCASACS
jgi:hypothetical protein